MFDWLVDDFFPGAGEIASSLLDQVTSDGAGYDYSTPPYFPPAPPPPVFSGIGASKVDDWGGFTIDPNTGDVTGSSNAGGSFSPTSLPPLVSSVLGSVLGAVVPSAEAGILSQAAKVITGAGAAAAGAAVIGVGRMSNNVIIALMKLRTALTGMSGNITPGALAAFGSKTWSSLAAWARANPTTSVLGILTALGLTAEEAATFLGWGATKKMRGQAGRRRGITSRDLKTTRRTMRRITSMARSLQHLCAAVPHRRRAARA